MSGYDLEHYLKRLNINTWCHNCQGRFKVFISRPYSQSNDTVRIDLDCIECDIGIVLEVKE